MIHIPASRIAISVGLFGLVPFIVLGACAHFVAPHWQIQFIRALAAYGAVILAFLGAVHWGAALAGGDNTQNVWRFTYGVMPAILGWVTMLCPTGPALFLLFLGFVAAFAVDRNTWKENEWYITLRAILSTIVCLSLYAGYKAL